MVRSLCSLHTDQCTPWTVGLDRPALMAAVLSVRALGNREQGSPSRNDK